MHVADYRITGWFPLQHHDPAVDLGARKRMAAFRLHPTDEPGDEDPGLDTYGDVLGGLLVRSIDDRRDHVHAWFLTGAPLVATSGAAGPADPTKSRARAAESWSLVRYADCTPDDRLETKRPGRPAWWDGVWPTGWTAELGAGTHEDAQEEVLHPDFWGLVAVNAAGNPRAGTPIYDLNPDGTPGRHARMQSFVSVIDTTGIEGLEGPAIAHQLGKGGRLDDHHGHFLFVNYDKDEVAIGERGWGGPFSSGDGRCQHNLGKDGDGRGAHPLHNDTNTLFLGLGGDAPLMFRPERWNQPGGVPGVVWQEVFCKLDPEQPHRAGRAHGMGAWKWQVLLPIYTPPPVGDRWPPPPDPPGDEPRPPGDPPPSGRPPKPPRIPTGDPGDSQGDPGGSRLRNPGGDAFPLNPHPPAFGPGGFLATGDGYGVSPGGGPPLVGGVAKPAFPHMPSCLAIPNVIFKASATLVGSTLLSGSRTQPTQAQLRAFEDAPQTAQIEGWGLGDGSWGGFSNTRANDASTHAAANGGAAMLPPDVTMAEVLNGTASTAMETTYAIPPGLTSLAFATPSRTVAGGVASGFVQRAPTGGASLTSVHRNATGATGLGTKQTSAGRFGTIAADGTDLATMTAEGGMQVSSQAGSAAVAAGAGKQALFLDSETGHMSRVDEDGVVVDLETGSGGGGLAMRAFMGNEGNWGLFGGETTLNGTAPPGTP